MTGILRCPTLYFLIYKNKEITVKGETGKSLTRLQNFINLKA